MQIHEAVDARAQGVTAVELGGDRLELGAGRAEGDRKVIHAVRVVGKQHALDAARSPVAGENAEEYLTQPPLPADVRLGELSGDILRRIPVGIVLEPRVHDRVTHPDEWAEQEFCAESEVPEGARVPPARWHAAIELERVPHRLRGRRGAGAQFHPIVRPALGGLPLCKDAADGGSHARRERARVRPGECAGHVTLLQGARQGRRVGDDTGRDEVLDEGHGPVVEGNVWRGLLGRER